ncbi:hypothetical protein ANCDUO_00011 [Ancylostoma duodenale]|uniref:Dpy-30 motif protein n=1 Tax=Ancylostoma duodenale TaxID=51022 RepID=A0A0C2H6X5_9BILA|nr:hypothetical protein ANCDUO_00011 [Ancylostoma duodenale]
MADAATESAPAPTETAAAPAEAAQAPVESMETGEAPPAAGPTTTEALGALAKERPENPIDFLINFLIKEKERYQPSTENVS